MIPVTGPCEAYIPSWFYNKDSKRCEEFIYGGCFGNQNRFETKEACEERCVATCFQSPKTGPCEALIQRWFYNAKSGDCEKFTYGGCEANMNNFLSKEDCEDECAGWYTKSDYTYICSNLIH